MPRPTPAVPGPFGFAREIPDLPAARRRPRHPFVEPHGRRETSSWSWSARPLDQAGARGRASEERMGHGVVEWGAFGAFVLAMLALDLGIFHRRDHEVRPREALAWSAVWVALALAFAGYVGFRHGGGAGLEFLTGYVIEKSLSVDNIFVFVVIFAAFGIPALYQHRVLFWGIVTALVLRGAMIAAGSALLERFHGIIYVFGGFLVLTGAKLFLQRGAAPHPEKSAAFRLLARVVPGTPRFDGHRFF